MNSQIETSPTFQTLATPGRYAFPVWHVIELPENVFGNRTLAVRTDHRSDPFSEFLLLDLETLEYRGVVIDGLPEIGAKCFFQIPGSHEFLAVRASGVYRVDFRSGTSTQVCYDKTREGELPVMGAWQDEENLLILCHGERPAIYQVHLGSEISMRLEADLSPDSKKIGYSYLPQQFHVTPGGKVISLMGPGLFLAWYDPQSGEKKILFNESGISMTRQCVPPYLTSVVIENGIIYAGGKCFEMESGEPCFDQRVPPEYLFKRFLGKHVGGNEVLYDFDQKSGKMLHWGKKPPAYLVEPPEGDSRWEDSITWYTTHGKKAFGFSRLTDPKVELVCYDALNDELELKTLDWKPEKAQKYYSLHLGPDGKFYGSNYGLNLWQIDPETKTQKDLGWAVPARVGGEIWEFVNCGEKMYFASYTKSWFSVYNPAKAWDPGVHKGANPRNLFRLYDHAPDQHRPRGLTVDRNGFVYLASCADYGAAHEGAMGIVNSETEELVHVEYPVSTDHQLQCLAASKEQDEVYVGTYKGEWWLSAVAGNLVIYDTKARKVKREFEMSNTVSCLTVVDEKLIGLVRKDWTIFVYDIKSREFTEPFKLEKRLTFFVGSRPSSGKFMIQQESKVYEMDPHTLKLKPLLPEGETIKGAGLIEAHDGNIYFQDNEGFDVNFFRPVDR